MHNRLMFTVFLALLCIACGTKDSTDATPTHPLDPLSRSELVRVVGILKASIHFDESARLVQVSLYEPGKPFVRQWQPGDSLQRKAFVVVRQAHQTYEAIVDLKSGVVTRWQHIPDAQPQLLDSEFRRAKKLLKQHVPWQEAMHRRGIDDFRKLYIDTQFLSVTPADSGDKRKRLVQVLTYDRRGADNFYARPISGVRAIIDLDENKLVAFSDAMPGMPSPDNNPDYGKGIVKTLRRLSPLNFIDSGKSDFTLDGHTVRWQNWSFHHRIDPRVGLIISRVTYRDGEREREMLYRGNLSELYVPYQDPAPDWYSRAFLDLAEYSGSGLLYGLEPGADCPDNAVYFSAQVIDEAGQVSSKERLTCLFERPTGNPAWRHDHSISGKIESRPARQLVMRMIAVVGNYDYAVDWIFNQSGSLTIAVGATGIVAVKAVASRTAADDYSGDADRYGRFVDAHTVAVNHSHYFNFRLDVDVDGTANSMVFDSLEKADGEAISHRGLWRVESNTAASELAARASKNIRQPKMWRIVNPAQLNAMGYPSSLALIPGGSLLPIAGTGADAGRRRGEFTRYSLWVTPYRREEMYAAGRYPARAGGVRGLPAWTARDRAIKNTDIVAWYNIGMHHIVRAEDWPIMPTHWESFTLKPFDFFARNPALDLPKN